MGKRSGRRDGFNKNIQKVRLELTWDTATALPLRLNMAIWTTYGISWSIQSGYHFIAYSWHNRILFASSKSEMSHHDIDLGHLPMAAPSRLPARLDGYPTFAQFIARDGDAAIFRKYAYLSARNLLYLQSELNELEVQLRQLDREDAKDIDNEEAQKAARLWGHYSDPNNDRARQHRILQGKIKVMLKEYRSYTKYSRR